jgi:hypothetical protein
MAVDVDVDVVADMDVDMAIDMAADMNVHVADDMDASRPCFYGPVSSGPNFLDPLII